MVSMACRPSAQPLYRGKGKLNHLTDEQLLMRFRRTGDRDFFSRLVRRYERPLYTYLRRYLGDAEMAEDAFQAAFLQVYLKRDQFEPTRRFRPWLYTIATNQAIDAQRRSKRHRLVSLDRGGADTEEELSRLLDLAVSSEENPYDVAVTEEARQWIRGSLVALPEHLREAVELVYFEGLKYREAADRLRIPVGTIKSRLHAAVTRLTEVSEEAGIES